VYRFHKGAVLVDDEPVEKEAIGASIYGTDVNGTVVVSTNGETYDVQVEAP
jgi:beta-lactamase superfamily II metal-dependent hydrolase